MLQLTRRLLIAVGLCLVAASLARAEEVRELWRSPSGIPRAVSVNPIDGSWWMAGTTSLTLFASDDHVLAQVSGSFNPKAVAANPTDGSCWLAEPGRVSRFAADGGLIWTGTAFANPMSVSVDPADGSCWVADTGTGDQSSGWTDSAVVHLAANGTELLRITAPGSPCSVSVNVSDSSCWVADQALGEVLHLDSAGTELLRLNGFNNPLSVSANASDGSCWVADTGNDQVVYLAASGAELWRGGRFSGPQAVSVDEDNGSCWVADTNNGQLVHLGVVPDASFVADPLSGHIPLPVSFTDTSVGYPKAWLWDFGDGNTSTDQNPSHAYSAPGDYTVSLTVSSAYGADTETKTDYIAVGMPPVPVADFSAVPTSGNAPLDVTFTDQSAGAMIAAWEWDFGDGGTATTENPSHAYDTPGIYDVALTVNDNYTSDTETKTDYIRVGFPDTPPGDFWAFNEVLECVDAGVVTGYEDGLYHPDWEVTRDQMAVYVARASKLLW
jgi:PKD repeat protein